jgi:hypothetical protein
MSSSKKFFLNISLKELLTSSKISNLTHLYFCKKKQEKLLSKYFQNIDLKALALHKTKTTQKLRNKNTTTNKI